MSGVIALLEGASVGTSGVRVGQAAREALTQARGLPTALRDPRLSRAGNWLGQAVDADVGRLDAMENWLRTPNERRVARPGSRAYLQPLLQRAGDEASLVAELLLGPNQAWARRVS